MLHVGLLVVALLGSTTIASAQWITDEQGGAFDDDPLRIAATAAQDYVFGVRCKADRSEVVYITPDRSFDRETYKIANSTRPKLRLRIDRGEILTFDAQIDDLDGKAAFIADIGIDVYRAIGNARNSVSVVTVLLGQNYHENSFGVRGTRAAMNKLIAGCKLAERKN